MCIYGTHKQYIRRSTLKSNKKYFNSGGDSEIYCKHGECVLYILLSHSLSITQFFSPIITWKILFFAKTIYFPLTSSITFENDDDNDDYLTVTAERFNESGLRKNWICYYNLRKKS